MNDKNKNLNTMVKGGLIMTASSFIVKLLSAIYKVPFQNLTGDAGFYVYQQIYPLYGLAVAFSLNGLPTFVSKVVTEAEDEQSLREKMREMNTWFSAFSLFLFLLLQIGSHNIAQLMGDIQLAPVIRTVSFFYLFLPFISLVRGLFQGQTNMLPTSMSQVVEQLIRVLILLGTAILFTKKSWTVYEMGVTAYHSSWISALAASIVLLLYLRRRMSIKYFFGELTPKWSLAMGKRMITEGGLIIVTSSIMVLFQFIDSFTVFNGLVNSGFSNEMAMSLKGVYDRGQPMVQLGLVVGLGFSTTSLPMLRKWAIEDRWQEWSEHAASLLKINILLAGAATVGLVAVMPWMNFTLFTDYSGTDTIQIFVLSIFFASLIYCLHTILQSTGHTDNSLIILVIGFFFKIIMNPLAVRNMGINGSSMVTVFALMIITLLLTQLVRKEVWQHVVSNYFIVKAFGLLLGMYVAVRGTLVFLGNVLVLTSRFSALILVLVGVAIGVLSFVIGTIGLSLLTEEELKQLPLSKMMKIRKRK